MNEYTIQIQAPSGYSIFTGTARKAEHLWAKGVKPGVVNAPVDSPFSFAYIAVTKNLHAKVNYTHWTMDAFSGDTDRWQVFPATALGKDPLDANHLTHLLRNPKWENVASDATGWMKAHSPGEPLIFRPLPDPVKGMAFPLAIAFKPDQPSATEVTSDWLRLLDAHHYSETMEQLEILEEYLKVCRGVTVEIRGPHRRALKLMHHLKDQGVDTPLTMEEGPELSVTFW